MARAAAEDLDQIRGIDIAVGTVSRGADDEEHPLATSYSILTVLDEASRPAPVFTGGRLTFVEPLSHETTVDFPAPVGRQHPACVLHSELATLPASFAHKGLREASFRIAFPGRLAERLRFIHALGLTSTEPLDVNRARVIPRDVLLGLLGRGPAPRPAKAGDDYEVLRVSARGRRAKLRREQTLDCLVPGFREWNVGADIDTGAPPSIVAQMLLSGEIGARGVLPPERCIPPTSFFRALQRRGMRIVRRAPHA
jgi:saccharopine dehydrogenase-like NADP-dependent oxidoreductase